MTTFRATRGGPLSVLLALAPTGAQAAKTTVNDITLDVSAGYQVSSSKRGVLVKSQDNEVDVWIEPSSGRSRRP